MESIFSRYKNALVLMLVVLAQVVLLAMQVRRPAPDMPDGHNVRLWRYWVAAVVTPPERLAHNVGLGFRGVWSNYIYLRHLREQNEDLQAENDRLRLEQASLAEDARSGQRLRELLDFRGEYIDQTLPAQVIGTSGTDQAHVIYIDKGYKDGLRVQMPVITPDGVVGKIKNVFPHTAQVLLISDQTSGAGVMLQSTRIRGVMKGNAAGQPQIINISPDDRIQPGEEVLTSGGDQVYPLGLPVGVVEKVVADPDTSFVNVVIKPNANLAKLEEVLVVTGFSDKMPFSQEKDIMQSEVDAYAEKERAADILSEKLPSLRNADVPESSLAGGDAEAAGAATAGGGDPARPMRPPQALHADRYTPGAAPPAGTLMPGQAPPGLHRDLSTTTNEPVTPKAPKTATSPDNGMEAATAGGAGALKSRFPPKPVAAPAVPPASIKPTGGSGSATGAATASSPTNGISTSGLSSAARPATRPSGSGFALPLQPADSTAARRSAAASGVDDATTAHVPRPLTSGTGTTGSTSPTGGEAAVPRAPRPAGIGSSSGTGRTAASTSVSGGGTAVPHAVRSTGTGNAGSAGASAGSHRIVIPGDTGGSGILTPAGMGSFGSTPKPRVATTTGGTTAAAGSGGTAGGTSSGVAHPATTAKPASKPPGATAPGSRPAPTTVPARPTATAPPGGY
jgi:rod shape-determining protein MreC